MGEIGYGYGSECHLLRYMGRHRHELDRQILAIVGGDNVDWLDFGFQSSKPWPDAEIKGLDFLSPDDPVRNAWKEWWPQGRGIHNWDAVGKVRFGDAEEWLLVEAKANKEELISDCRATSPTSCPKIEAAFAETKSALGVPGDRDWLHGYYQFCNRLAALYFLNDRGVPAHLLYIYFTGDRGDPRRTCPGFEEEWRACLQEQEQHVGLPKGHKLEKRLHKLFLPVILTPPSGQTSYRAT